MIVKEDGRLAGHAALGEHDRRAVGGMQLHAQAQATQQLRHRRGGFRLRAAFGSYRRQRNELRQLVMKLLPQGFGQPCGCVIRAGRTVCHAA
jgi:hypothetical protein